jgi:hypothetical protein
MLRDRTANQQPEKKYARAQTREQKENTLKLQQTIRVAVCAVIVTLLIANAGLFAAQPVTKRKTKPVALKGAAALNQLKQDGQYDAAQAVLKQARFGVNRAEHTPLGRPAWHAPNPTAGYDAYITETGVSIAINNQSYVSLNLHSLGYGKALRNVAPGEISSDKQSINLRRDGGVQEWYVNSPDGLEQGFTLAEAPGVRQQGVPLRLALQVSEGWQATAGEDGQQVMLQSADGQVIEYSKLVVYDSQERNLPARMTVTKGQVVIEVEDSEATYPLTIDPTFTLQQKLWAADGVVDYMFGNSVALDGNTLVVGAWGDGGGSGVEGSAYVFTRNGTVWTLQQKLTATVGNAYNAFGNSVALDGDTLVVGASQDNVGASTYQGSAYVFTRSGTVWTLQQRLTANDGVSNTNFGSAVALDGNTIVVGAITHPGSAYVFTRNGTVWTQQQKLMANDGDQYDNFGKAVALDNDTLVVGAEWDDINANLDQGSAYVFTRNGTVWTQQQKLTASDGAGGDTFGVTVTLSGDTLMVGAPWDDIGANNGQGSVYYFTRSGTLWSQQQKLIANDGATNDSFGSAVALSGDTLIIGASSDIINANLFQGSAYVFTRNGTVWSQEQKLTANDGAAHDAFGKAVAISNDTMVVGALRDDIGANSNQGSAYVFVRPPCPPLTLAPAQLPNGVLNTAYQQSLTVSGGNLGPYQFAVTAGALPPGLSLTASGLLSGTPTALGTYQFTIRATGFNSPCSTSRTYTITITPSCPTFMIDPPTLPSGTKGLLYNETLTATGGIEPYRFIKKSGVLPPGLSLSLNGVISGTPTQTGHFTFIVLITDETGCASTWTTSITITQREIE